MTEPRAPALTGGCQCGAVRYALYVEPTAADLCHCRMCQKAMGNLFMAVAGVPREQFAWTAGAPATYRSSSVAERTFCRDCGTPLSFRYLGRERISVTTGSLDEPARAQADRPERHREPGALVPRACRPARHHHGRRPAARRPRCGGQPSGRKARLSHKFM